MSSDDQKSIWKKKRSTPKGQFHRVLNYKFTKEERKDVAELEVLRQIINDLERAYTDMEEKHAALREVLNSED